MSRSNSFFQGMGNASWAAANHLMDRVLGALEPHSSFMVGGHPENEGSIHMADDMPMENQWGTVHRLENENTDDMWNHERAEYLTGTEEPGEHGHVSDAMSSDEVARRRAAQGE